MNLSRNFGPGLDPPQVVPGKYVDSSNRVVIVEGPPEMVEKRGNDLTVVTVEKWKGRRLRADGVTFDTLVWFTSEGCEWSNRSASSVDDLARIIQKLPGSVAA